jgi:predicted SAM-dependent methyltransferase
LKPGFLNVDLMPAADLRLDLRQPIPLEDGCASLIFSEHFLEHLRYPEDAEQFVGECYRLLEPGGSLLLSVPDAEWSLREYASGAQTFVEASREKLHYPHELRTTLEHVNYQFRQRWRGRSEHHFECHRFAYDLDTLRHLLTSQGFIQVKRRPFDVVLDKPVRAVDSLFVRAEKSS